MKILRWLVWFRWLLLTLPKKHGAFVLKCRVYHWRVIDVFLSKNNLRFLVKLSTENSYFRVIIFYLDELQLPIKISEEINQGINYSQISFLQKSVRIFLIQFICRKILIDVIHRIFRFWQVTKAKRRKTENPFVDNVFNHDLAKFQKDWSNIAIVGNHGRFAVNLLWKSRPQNTLHRCL